MSNHRLQTLLIILALAVLAVAGLLLLMGKLAGSPDAPVSVSTLSDPTLAAENLAKTADQLDPDGVVATVNDQSISRETWLKATRLDAVMSQLAAQPIPTAEETLDRLINEIIVLNTAFPLTKGQGGEPPASTEVEARLQALEIAWRVNDDAVATALTKAGLERVDLIERVSRLIQVESALKQISTQQTNLETWLAQARASAEIGVYRTLADAVQPIVTPTSLAAQSSASITPAATTPAPTVQTDNTNQEQPPLTPPADLPVAPYPQNIAPDFTLNQLNGAPLALSAFKGKPMLINFWATWCPPCRSELPALETAYQKYQDKVAFIAVDVKEDPTTVAAMVQELGLSFPIVLDPDGQISNGLYEVRGIPTSIFVDANGIISARHVGPLDETTIESYLAPLLSPVSTDAEAQQNSSTPASADLPDRQSAPDFTLTASNGSIISLSDYQDKSNVVVVFYRGYT